MTKTVRLTKGHDIKLVGQAYKFFSSVPLPTHFAVKPTDFIGIRPKVLVKPGDEVKAGTPLFFDKNNERIKFTAPVSGEVTEVVRGEKRKILGVKILADNVIKYEDFGKADPSSLQRQEIIEKLLQSGTWALIRQRPFSKIANPDENPKAIYISCFDSAPLAPDYNFMIKGQEQDFNNGLEVVKKLTSGKVHLNISGTGETAEVFSKAQGVEINKFIGPHPAGNVGVQIHHISPINKGDVIWYLSPQDVVIIGRLFSEGKYDARRIVALTGSEAIEKKYHKTYIGASIENMVKGNVEAGDLRYISGNVLTGTQIESNGYIGFYDQVITVIPEGNEPEFMGWLIPSYPRPSMSRTFPWTFQKDFEFKVNTNMHGEERPFVMTGQYEKVLPMDIYPMQLLKACMAEDIDTMEGLGIYEVAEEDFALVEFVDTSKLPIQSILRQGLNLIEKEG